MITKRLFAMLALIVAAFGFPSPAQTVRAQNSKPKGFEYAKPKPVEAPDAVPVVRSAAVKPVKIYELELEGPNSERHTGINVIVESVTLYSNGKMRWKFALKSKYERVDRMQINMLRSYHADADSETYPVVDREIKGDGSVDMELKAGVKTRFWLEFDAPKKPTSVLKTLIATDQTSNNSCGRDEFPPFFVRFPEPISAFPGAPEARPVAEAGAPADPDVPVVRSTAAVIKNSAGGTGLALAMRAIAKESQRFEGTYVTARGVKEAVVVAFQRDPDDEDGVAAQVYPVRTPIKKMLMNGWIMPDAKTASGLIIKMKGSGISYRFSYDGKVLSGLDNKGGKYMLAPAGKGPG